MARGTGGGRVRGTSRQAVARTLGAVIALTNGYLPPALSFLTFGDSFTAGTPASGASLVNIPATGALTLLIDGVASGLTVPTTGTTRAITGTPSRDGVLTISETGQVLGSVALPTIPAGFVFSVDLSGARQVDSSGAYLVELI